MTCAKANTRLLFSCDIEESDPHEDGNIKVTGNYNVPQLNLSIRSSGDGKKYFQVLNLFQPGAAAGLGGLSGSRPPMGPEPPPGQTCQPRRQ